MGTPPCFPTVSECSSEGAAFQPLGTRPRKQQEESLAAHHSNHCILTTDAVRTASVHCALLQTWGGKMHLNHVPSRDLLIAICSRKL